MARGLTILIGIYLIILSSSAHPIKAQDQIIFLPQEKVYIHTDRNSYSGGETIYYSAYLRSGLVDTLSSKILYIDLVDTEGEPIESQRVQLLDGIGTSSIDLPINVTSGNYLLRAYTNYMLNNDESFFFRKPLMIHGLNESKSISNMVDTSIQIFPEGGYILRDIASTIGIKVNHPSNSKKVEVYRNGKPLSSININENGYGKCNLLIRKGDSYELQYEESKHPIVDILDSGVMLSIETDTSIFTLHLNRSDDYNIAEHTIIMLSEGQLIYRTDALDKRYIFPKTDLPPGIITVALLNKDQKPISERLIFNHVGIDGINTELIHDNDSYNTRSKVSSTIRLTDSNDSPIRGTISASITDFRYHQEYLNCKAYMLLQSELRGTLDKHYSYLSNEVKTIERTDLLMLTQGWRRYTFSNEIDSLKQIELTQSISGRVVKQSNNTQGVKSYGNLAITTGMFTYLPFETDNDGYFHIDGVNIRDTSTLLFKVGKKRKSSGEIKYRTDLQVKLNAIQNVPISEDDLICIKNPLLSNTENSELYEIISSDEFYIDEGLLIEEVTISAKKIDKWVEYHRNNIYYTDPGGRILPEDIPAIETYSSIIQLVQGRVPGLQVKWIDRGGYRIQVFLVRNKIASILIDGFLVDYDILQNIRPENVAFIDILSGSFQTVAYGKNPIVAIYQRPPGERVKNPVRVSDDHILVSYKGFSSTKEFFNPTYDQDSYINEDIDRRTIGWFTDLKTDENGIVDLSFYTSDYIGTYFINLEGISASGDPISTEHRFTVNNE